MRSVSKRICPPALPWYLSKAEATGGVLADDERAVSIHSALRECGKYEPSRPQTLRRDRAAGAGLVGGDLMATTFSLAHRRSFERPHRLCGEPGKDGSENAGAARSLQCVFLCPAPGNHAGGRVCHRHQLSERNGAAADDPHQEALRQDGRLYRLARVSELQAGGGHAAACPRNRREAGKGNVGRPL